MLSELQKIAQKTNFQQFKDELDEYNGVHTDLYQDTGIIYVQHNPIAEEPSMTVIAEYDGETLEEPNSLTPEEIQQSLIGAGEVELNETIIENMRSEDLQNNKEYLYSK